MKYGKILSLFLLLVIVPGTQAESIEDLMASGELEARILVETPAPLYQKAPVRIAVEVGTLHGFSNGTRVRNFTVPGTLVRPSSKFAFTETRRRGGDSWDYQSWFIEIYSERTGTLQIPSLDIFISVNTGTNGVVEGEIPLPVPDLEIEAPPGTEGLASWIAATEFMVEESWEGVLDEYQIGDAVTRVRRFTVRGAPAMTIPASPQVKLDYVQVYEAPALVDDKLVGGSLQGVREERVVFTLEAGGSYTIPDHRIHWFNLNTKSVEQIDFPGRTLEVSGPAPPARKAAPQPKGESKNLWVWVLAVLGIVLTYLLLRWLLRKSWYLNLRDHLKVRRNRRQTKTDFMRAATQQDSRRCLELLYERMAEHAEWKLTAACSNDPKLSAVSAALMAHAYGGGKPPQTSELKLLWEMCTKKPINQHEHRSGLQLNPGPSR